MTDKLKKLNIDDLRSTINELQKDTANNDSLEFAQRIETIILTPNIDLDKWFETQDEFVRMQQAYRLAIGGDDQLTALKWSDLRD